MHSLLFVSRQNRREKAPSGPGQLLLVSPEDPEALPTGYSANRRSLQARGGNPQDKKVRHARVYLAGIQKQTEGILCRLPWIPATNTRE